jgi:hypothetical protein
LAIILYTLLALSIAYGIAWNNRKKGNVEAYCGRKVGKWMLDDNGVGTGKYIFILF